MSDGPKHDEWTPHIWEGASFYAWVRLLAVHRFAVHPRYWYVAAIVTVVSFVHSVLTLIQQIFYRHRVAKAQSPPDPVFIIGHWRTGTTLLHEYLIRDPRHAFANTYKCMEPNHFLLTEWLITRTMPFLMPERRPMDDMPAGWDHPQEDEFALCLMGEPSPYSHLGFPNQPVVDIDWLDFRGIQPERIARWSRRLKRFLREVAYVFPGRRLVLKSPPHTARVATLLKMFPNARFIHLVRDPVLVFASTIRLWKSLYRHHTLQVPTHEHLQTFVIEAGKRMYAALERDRTKIPPSQFFEFKYEELIANPLQCLQQLYQELDLGEFEMARGEFERYRDSLREYQPNRHVIDDQFRKLVERHWGEIIRRYGYSDDLPSS